MGATATATAAAATATEEFSAEASPHPIAPRDEISRSGNPSFRYIYIYTHELYMHKKIKQTRKN